MTTTNNTNKTANTDLVTETQFVDDILNKIDQAESQTELNVIESTIIEATAIVQAAKEEVLESSVQPKHKKAKKAKKAISPAQVVVDARVQAEHDLLVTPINVRLPESLQFKHGEKVAKVAWTIGDRSILKTQLVAMGISLRAYEPSVNLCKRAARSIASSGANLLVVGTHPGIVPAINAALAGGANVAIVLPFGINRFDITPWTQQICERRVCIISPVSPDAEGVSGNIQAANILAAKLSFSLFIGECYATKVFSDGSRQSKIWDLAKRVDEEGKNIFFPKKAAKYTRQEIEMVKEFGAIEIQSGNSKRKQASDIIGDEPADPFSILTQEIIEEEEILPESDGLDLGSLEDLENTPL